MPAIPPFNPPSPNLPGKPVVPDWIPPAATKQTEGFASLRVIDLSHIESDDPKVVDDLVQHVKTAIRDDGFLFIENYGVSLEQLHRQFSLAQYLHANISEEDQERLLFQPHLNGRWAGWKHPYGFKVTRGKPDGISQWNWYKKQWDDPENECPKCILPFMDEIRAFAEYLNDTVNRLLLKILSQVLELPDDYLWENVQSHGGPTGEGYFRHALFRPPPKEVEEAAKGQRMLGHSDYGTTTLLFSVPISCLQIWGRDEQWHYVPYRPGALVINIGETLELVSGGHFKATRHRVFKPPADQANEERLSLVQFSSAVGDVRMEPAAMSKLIQREGCIDQQGVYREFKAMREKGMPVPTNREWREIQIAMTVDPNDDRNSLGKDQVIIDGKLMNERYFHGVRQVLPV